jgi:hypothetical protein
MTKNMAGFAVCVGLALFSLMGCASTQPLDTSVVNAFGFNNDPEGFKKLQYYLSRDIRLTATESQASARIDAKGNVIIESNEAADNIEFLASDPGIVLQTSFNQAANCWELGVAFTESDDDLLWFGQVAGMDNEGYFYLLYHDAANYIVNYKGSRYKVTWGTKEVSTGTVVAAAFFGVSASATDDDPYADMPPLILYKGKKVSTKKSTTQRASGRKL